jgi:hypothetical protein
MKIRVWIHTCPGREELAKETLIAARVAAGGLFPETPIEVRKHPEGLDAAAIERWWREQWLDIAANYTEEWTIRVEDDVILDNDFFLGLDRWSALLEPDFGLGLLAPLHEYRQHSFTSTGTTPRGNHWATGPVVGGQVQIVRTAFIPRLLENIWLPSHPDYCPMWHFDCGLSNAVSRLGLKTYLHIPALAEHVGDVSAYRKGETRPDTFRVIREEPQTARRRIVGVSMGWDWLEESATLAVQSWSRAHGGLPWLVLEESDSQRFGGLTYLLKTQLWRIVPPWVDEIVYIDADTYTLRPWLNDIPDHCILAAVRDPGHDVIRTISTPNCWQDHYNSGLIYSHRASSGFFDDWYRTAQLPTISKWFMDQSSFNETLMTRRPKASPLPLRCNWLVRHCGEPPANVNMIHWAGTPRSEVLEKQKAQPPIEGELGYDVRELMGTQPMRRPVIPTIRRPTVR